MRDYVLVISVTVKAETEEQAEELGRKALLSFDKALGKKAVFTSDVDDVLEAQC